MLALAADTCMMCFPRVAPFPVFAAVLVPSVGVVSFAGCVVLICDVNVASVSGRKSI